MKKVLPLIAVMAGIALLFASLGFAELPPPPVNQTIGFDDTVFSNLTEADCRGCHSSGVPDRHHMLYGSSMPQGICSATTGTCGPVGGEECADDSACLTAGDTCVVVDRECFDDADCVLGINICSNTGDPCTVAEDCPKQYQHPTCDNTPYCAGTSAAQNNPNNFVYGCLSCHDEDNAGGVINFIVYRDCTTCHVQLPNSPTVHHLDESAEKAKAGLCVVCHGDVVDDKDDGHYIPTYSASMVTPEPSSHSDSTCSVTTATVCDVDADCPASETCEENPPVGACTVCHDSGTDTASGVEVGRNYDTHHGAGIYKDRYGGTVGGRDICAWCHKTGYPHNDPFCTVGGEFPYPDGVPYGTSSDCSTDADCATGETCMSGYDADRIRNCENCHGPESLHNIQADSNGGGIEVGGELYGYGHIGIDDPSGDSDCFGCHGFSVASEGLTGSGVPSIHTVDPMSMTAGTQVTITGAALTTALPLASSDVRLTAADGSTVTIAPDSISEGSLTVTINAAPGAYSLQAVKDSEASNAVGIAVLPAVVVEDIDCSKCLGVMTITGANFAKRPEGAADINVTEGGVELDVIEWTDTMIKAAGARCGGDVTVNSVYGSSN